MRIKKHVQNWIVLDLQKRTVTVTPIFWDGCFFSFGCYQVFSI